MDIDNLIDTELTKKYESCYKSIREKIMDACNLPFAGTWMVHSVSSSGNISANLMSMSLEDIDNDKKGHYIRKTDTISISDWCLERPNSEETCRVIIHELLHAQGYEHGTEMYKQTEICLRKVKQKYPSLITY